LGDSVPQTPCELLKKFDKTFNVFIKLLKLKFVHFSKWRGLGQRPKVLIFSPKVLIFKKERSPRHG